MASNTSPSDEVVLVCPTIKLISGQEHILGPCELVIHIKVLLCIEFPTALIHQIVVFDEKLQVPLQDELPSYVTTPSNI